MNLDWQDDAACRDLPLAEINRIFFPGGDHVGKHPARLDREGVRICKTCPVQNECLDSALEMDIAHGIYGGFTEMERRRITRDRRRWHIA